MRYILIILAAFVIASCAKAPVADISVDEAKVVAWVKSPKLFPDGITILPRDASLSKKQLLELNVFILQIAAVGDANKEEVHLPKDSDLFRSVDVTMIDFTEWKQLKAEFSVSSYVPASKVAAVVEHFAR